jgi:hypothetical protein
LKQTIVYEPIGERPIASPDFLIDPAHDENMDEVPKPPDVWTAKKIAALMRCGDAFAENLTFGRHC